jgi:hypothetical protein
MFLSTAGPSTFDFAVAPAGPIESGLRRMLTKITGEAALKISLEGFPRGTRTAPVAGRIAVSGDLG